MVAVPEILDKIVLQTATEETEPGGSPMAVLRALLADPDALERLSPLIVARYRAAVRVAVAKETVAPPVAEQRAELSPVRPLPRLRGLMPWKQR